MRYAVNHLQPSGIEAPLAPRRLLEWNTEGSIGMFWRQLEGGAPKSPWNIVFIRASVLWREIHVFPKQLDLHGYHRDLQNCPDKFWIPGLSKCPVVFMNEYFRCCHTTWMQVDGGIIETWAHI